MIEVLNIQKRFGDKHVLKDVSVTFDQGKTNLIIGKSGTGKTVLLKAIIGLYDIDEGEILYDNRSYTKMDSNQRKALRKEMGMLFQGAALFDSLSVEENIKFPLDMFSIMTEEEKQDRVNFCLKRVNMINSNKLFPREISGGMKKRVAIARAIVQNPSYLFCDEPNSGLDPKTSIVIDELISEITHEFNMTTIVNTHDMNSVMDIGEKIVFIHDGQKFWEGTKDEVFTSDNEQLNDFIFASSLTKRIRNQF